MDVSQDMNNVAEYLLRGNDRDLLPLNVKCHTFFVGI